MTPTAHDAIIFDLDGTLWDASAVTAAGWNAALAQNGLERYAIDHADIKNVSGLPFGECVERLFGHIPGVAIADLEKHIDREEEKIFATRRGEIYPGVERGISVLAKHYPLFLVSNCQSWYLRVFWDQFNLEKYFTGHDCNGNANQQKPEMIRGLKNRHKLENALYVGDTDGDKNSSRAAGVAFGHARYGFGEVGEADMTFRSFPDLVARLTDS